MLTFKEYLVREGVTDENILGHIGVGAVELGAHAIGGAAKLAGKGLMGLGKLAWRGAKELGTAMSPPEVDPETRMTKAELRLRGKPYQMWYIKKFGMPAV